jgi:hypothetical protein
MENRKVKEVLYEGCYQWKGEGYKERVKEAECSENIMHGNGRNETCATIQGMWGGG